MAEPVPLPPGPGVPTSELVPAPAEAVPGPAHVLRFVHPALHHFAKLTMPSGELDL